MKPRILNTARLSFPLATALAALLAVSSASAQLYWDSNSTTAGAGATPTGIWGTSNFWNTDPLGGGAGAFQIGTLNTDDLYFVAAPGAASGNNAYAVTVDTAQVANSLTFQASGATTLSGGTSITLGDGTPGSGGITMNQFAYGSTNQGAVTINTTPVFLNNSQTWTNNSASLFTKTNASLITNNGHELTIAGKGNFTFGTINNNTATLTGSGNLVKSGSGTFALSGLNAGFTGNTILNGGTLLVTALGSIGSGNLTLNGGIYEEYWTNTFSRALGSGAGQVQLTGGASGFSENGSTGMTVNLGGSAATVVWGSTFFNPSTLVLQSAAAQTNSTLNFQNGINLNGATRTIASYKTSNLASGATISGVISETPAGTAGLIKEGAGLLILSNTNTYAGSTTISAGILQANSTAAIGNSSATNTLIFNGGTLRAGGAITSVATRSVTMTATGIIDTNNQLVSIAGDIGGVGGLTKNGANTLTLTGTNTYGGVTTVTAGTLAITKEASLASNTAANLNVKSGATLQLNVDSAGTAGFTSTNLSTLLGNISVANTAAEGLQAGAILAIDTSTATGATFAQGNAITNSTGAFGGVINLTKLGAGTLVLDKANTYTGLTTISAGTLQLNDGGSISSTLINNGVLLVNKTGAVTMGTDFPANIGGTGSIAFGASSTLTLTTPAQFQFGALNTTGGGGIILSGVTTPVFGGLVGATGDLATVISSGYSGVTNLTLNTPAGNSFTYAGVIADGAAGMNLTKTGAGTQILTGNNTYTGETYLNGGTLTLGSGTGKLSGTAGLTFNGGTLQFNRSTNADIDAINTAATITVNSSSTFGVTSADAGGASANETIGAVTLNAGQMNFNWTNGGSSGTQMILTSVAQSGTASANFNSGFASNNSRWKVTGAGTTTGGQIIGPWLTTGGNNAGFASTDYALYSSDFVAQAAIAGSAETAWTNAANAYTNSLAGQTLTATRTVTALRNTGATATMTLASGANLETYGLLNGVATLLTVAPGTGGVLTTPTGGGNLYLTPGAGAITVSAPINNNGGNVTLVKNGSNTLTLGSTTSTYSGGTVINAGTVAFTADTNLGATGTGITFDGSATLTNNTGTTLIDLGSRSISVNNGAIATITGAARGNTAIGGAITGDGGVTLAFGTFWGKAALNSTSNTFKGALTVTGGNDDGNSLFSINSIADGSGYGNIILNVSSSEGDLIGLDYGTGGTNGTGGGGAIAPLVLDHRQIVVQGTSTNVFNNASNQAVTINTDIGFSGTGAKSMRFGVNARAGSGVNTFAGKLTDNAGGALSPSFGGGTWVVSNSNNNYTGNTGVNGGTVTFSGNNTLTGQFTISGSGSLTLSGNNSGMSSNVVLSTATGTVASSPRLNINSATALGTGILNFGGGAATDVVRIDNTSLGAVNVSTANAITMNRNFTFVGTQDLSLGTGTTTLGGMTSGNNRSITVTANTLTLNGTIAEAVANLGITKAGAGTLVLSGTGNSYTGATTVSAGTLAGIGASAFGSTSGISIAAAGTLSLRGDSNTNFVKTSDSSPYTVSNSASGATINVDRVSGSGAATMTVGNLTTTSTAASWGLNFTGANGVSLSAGTLNTPVSTAGSQVHTITNNIAGGGTLTLASVFNQATTVASPDLVFAGTGTTIVTGAITQTLATMELKKSGAGTVTLEGSNTYTGPTAINGGTLVITGATQSTSAITFSGGGILGLKTSASVAATSTSVDFTGQSVLVTGPTGAPSYTLLTAVITGTEPTLAVPVPGYELDVVGNELRLVQTGAGDPFTTWSGAADFETDTNNDGVNNGLAWLLGAPDKNTSAIGLLPTLDNTSDPDYFIFTYRRKDDASTDPNTTITAEYSTTLGSWTTAVDDVGSDIDIIVTDNHYSVTPGVDRVEVKLKRSALASGGKLFARLKGTQP